MDFFCETVGLASHRIREFCITDEKWFASGESNVFRLSRDYVNGLS
jgi:hypothetical protein